MVLYVFSNFIIFCYIERLHLNYILKNIKNNILMCYIIIIVFIKLKIDGSDNPNLN